MEFINEAKKVAGWFLIGVLFFALSIIIGSSGVEAESFVRVTFGEGKDTVEFADSASMGERDTFVVALAKGESCEVDVLWKGDDLEDEGQGLSGFSIIFPDGEELTDTQDGYIRAATAGDHKIVVSPKTKKTNYRYRIIFKRVER